MEMSPSVPPLHSCRPTLRKTLDAKRDSATSMQQNAAARQWRVDVLNLASSERKIRAQTGRARPMQRTRAWSRRRHFVEIEGDVGLALMVRFVPGQDVEDVEEGELALFEGVGDDAKVFVAEQAERFQQVGTRFGEDLANERGRRDFIVRRAAAFEAWNKFGEGRFGAGDEALCGKKFLRDPKCA